MLQQKQQLKQVQKLTPQQIQLMKLLQIPVMMLDQRIKEELEINPVLEEVENNDEENEKLSNEEESLQNDTIEEEKEKDEKWDDPDLDYYLNTSDDDAPNLASNYEHEESSKEIPIRSGTTFYDNLLDQFYLLNLTEDEFKIGESIIGNLDENGYMRMDLHALSDDILFSQNIQASPAEILKVLHAIQKLDPAGIAACNLQECLILQMERLPQTSITKNALIILQKNFDAFVNKKYTKILENLHISEGELQEVINLITSLNPKPAAVSESENPYVIPDFTVANHDGELVLQLNGNNIPELRINRTYTKLLDQYISNAAVSKNKKDTVSFIKQKIEAANQFIDALKQRNRTLLCTMEAIMEHQARFFITGDNRDLHPMKLDDIAAEIGLDVSTVSRVVNSKYVQTPAGIFLLKDFFSKSVENQKGENISNKEIMEALRDAIQDEDFRNPLTDQELLDILIKKGYKIARRTIAQYRENLGIPVARLRKKL